MGFVRWGTFRGTLCALILPFSKLNTNQPRNSFHVFVYFIYIIQQFCILVYQKKKKEFCILPMRSKVYFFFFLINGQKCTCTTIRCVSLINKFIKSAYVSGEG